MFEASPSEISVTFYTGSNKPFVEKFADEFVEKFVENENQRTILKLMLEQPTISAKSVADRIGMTPRGVQKNIETLKNIGLLERVGAAKGGYWVVKQPNK